jgi:lactoylglutathione lyase
MKPQGSLDHIGVYVKDLERSLKFYGEVFGFPEHHRFSVGEAKIAVLDTGKGLLEIIERPGAPPEPPRGNWSHIAFHIDDYNALLSKLEKKGLELRKVTIADRPRIAFFRDPDGYDVEIMEKGLDAL